MLRQRLTLLLRFTGTAFRVSNLAVKVKDDFVTYVRFALVGISFFCNILRNLKYLKYRFCESKICFKFRITPVHPHVPQFVSHVYHITY
ncbi:hypothetical protein L596_002490 [Steinernema carpocapsae]|uniref:Uncharacterized protein n=1 Tax=Steinernema carpocapsae TaxID=34508 RepID=A0A4V6I7Q7_STECR|nr:hypothetical protein L596_002490 [Steinernema carpocapsae]